MSAPNKDNLLYLAVLVQPERSVLEGPVWNMEKNKPLSELQGFCIHSTILEQYRNVEWGGHYTLE